MKCGIEIIILVHGNYALNANNPRGTVKRIRGGLYQENPFVEIVG
jgi:hypothetical protein